MEGESELVYDLPNGAVSDFNVAIKRQIINWKRYKTWSYTYTMADRYEVVYDISIDVIFKDLEQPLTRISRSRQYSTLNMSLAVQDRHWPTMYN